MSSYEEKRMDKIVRRLNEAGARCHAARTALSNAVFDLQHSVDLLLPLPAASRRLGRLLAAAELQMREVRGAYERLEVRLEQLRQMAAVAVRK